MLISWQLVREGADVNMTKVDHYTPLMAACENGNKSCVEMLLEEGANVNACAVNGNSAAILTAANGSAECLDLLIQAGADVNQMTNQQMTALQCAVMAGNKQCVKLLAQTDADINTVGPRGWTPLMQAIVKNHPECASVLLQKGADVNYVNHQGVSVLSVAAASTVCSVQLLLSNRVHVQSQTGTYGESTLESYIYDFPKLNQNIILLLLAAGEAMGPDMLQEVPELRESSMKYVRNLLEEKRGSLKSLCREAVRNALLARSPVNLFCRVPQLEPELPVSLLPYLLYDMSLEAEYQDLSEDDNEGKDEEDGDDSWITTDDDDDDDDHNDDDYSDDTVDDNDVDYNDCDVDDDDVDYNDYDVGDDDDALEADDDFF